MVRPYQDSDYSQLKGLYQHPEWFGGQFDEARDSREKLSKIISMDPEAIWVDEENGQLLGTVSLIEDGRVAWLFRFAVKNNDKIIRKALYDKATELLKGRGHAQVLVYSPKDDDLLADRYQQLGMTKGNDFTAYWQNI